MATFLLFTVLSLPGAVLALVVASWRYGVRLAWTIAGWAMKNNFDAVIGIRIEPHPHASYNSLGSSLKWTIYGTAIGW